MLKYVNTGVVFQEIPDETTLSINISGCPNRCPGCHSRYLWADTGTILDTDAIDTFVEEYRNDFTCICFMGGDNDPAEVERLALYVHQRYPQLKVGWYSGKQYFPHHIDRNSFDYFKLGPYIAHLGCLKDRNTNQRMYQKTAHNCFEDITARFWETE
ncbi:anaerobic ribonucleoside-triphosphate reductase activating protein [Prevotella sp. OH937_COT-195]|uniref:anaerobic ribonucleoside-triphosphate reductase activating protein n=1 Tax=Prevotella sp. OH937_COT-195 TaxID=2491051 RepID=UPI000F648379|nr:anaerobic ribonucleoside-triphosphate reductase activating protein [Prevotella sp. OH937_COT-195]RRD01953.1 anaerobic ribonucleoside-triphosphate reductase activating protein [Prevotella sp. OH937_COT-195]